MNKNLHVVVLMGGWSNEREVSLTSGKGVAEALRERGWTNVTELDMDRDVALRLAELKPDVVFNALHGTPGEDGTVQGMMDLMGLRYTHSGLTTSAIAIDKELTKAVLVPHGIRMPKGKMVDSESLHREDPLPRPYVVKPVNEGSSVGVAIVTDGRQLRQPDRPRRAGPVGRVRRAARRALHQGPRADRRGAERRAAGGDRAQDRQRLLRLRAQIYRRPDGPRLPRRRARRHRRRR